MAPRAWLFLTLAIAGLAVAPASQAAVFAVVRAEPDTITVMDPAAVEAVPGAVNLRRAYSVTVQKTLSAEGPQQPGYVRTLNEYDCAARTIRWKNFSVYSRFGDLVIHKDNVEQTSNQAPQGVEAGVSMRLVCDHASPSSAVAATSLSQLVIGLMKAWDDAAPLPPEQPVKPLRPLKKPAARPAKKTVKAA
jgi:hypothetical protein